MDKYCLTDETKVIYGVKLHRIKALKDFGCIKAGNLGGFIETEENLSQEKEAWVYENACVFENARICDNAQVFGSAMVFGYACIFGSAMVYGYAQVAGDARVSGHACIFGSARVYKDAQVFGSAKAFGYASIFGKAMVYGYAQVAGDAQVYDDAIISQDQYVSYGVVRTDLSKTENLAKSIKAQCNLPAINNKVIAYKLVTPDLTSFYDRYFHYEVGKEIEAKDCEESNRSCASGLHFSNLTYWENCLNKEYVYLEAEIDLNDIITVQEGKIRCRKAKILRSFSI